MTASRDEAPGHSPTLERLAARNPVAAEILEIERVPEATREPAIGAALGDVAPIGCLAMIGYLVTIGLVIAWLVGAVAPSMLALGVASIAAGHAWHILARSAWHRRVARRLTWVDQRPFPITGVRGYLAASRPMIDVRFQTAPKAATVIAGIRGHDPEADVTQIDDQTFRVVLRGGGPADEPELRRFVDEVLVPVDEDLGIESVTLGGKRVTLPARR